jgi:hypothetical protein
MNHVQATKIAKNFILRTLKRENIKMDIILTQQFEEEYNANNAKRFLI